MVAGHWHGCNGQCHLTVLAMDSNKTMTKAGGGQQRNNQPMMGAAKVGGGWQQDHLRAALLFCGESGQQ
jgi:hypothetical protein